MAPSLEIGTQIIYLREQWPRRSFVPPTLLHQGGRAAVIVEEPVTGASHGCVTRLSQMVASHGHIARGALYLCDQLLCKMGRIFSTRLSSALLFLRLSMRFSFP